MRLKPYATSILNKTPAIVGVAGAVYIVAWAARGGPVMHSDSYRYFEAATLMAEGKAFVSREFALLYFAPFYPMLLAAMISIFSMSVTRAAVLLNAAIFGLNLYLAGATLRRATGSAGAGAAAALILLVSARFRLDHLEPLSDPLFTLLCQICLFALVAHERAGEAAPQSSEAPPQTVQRDTSSIPGLRFARSLLSQPRYAGTSRACPPETLTETYTSRRASTARRWMVVATGAAGLSALTRYVGYVTVIAAALGLWRLTGLKHARREWWREAAWIVGLTASSVLPNLAWHARNIALHGVALGGDLRDNELTAAESIVNLAAHTGRYWSLSTSASPVHVVVALAFLVVAIAGTWRAGARFLASYWIVAVVYSVGLVASASALDALWRSEYAQPLFVVLNSLVVAAVVSAARR